LTKAVFLLAWLEEKEKAFTSSRWTSYGLIRNPL